ncbi:MAG: CFI-box-CTERM domain-containing protein [archaeon]
MSDPLIPWKPRPVLGRIKTLVLPVQFSDVRLRSPISKISSSMDSINSWFRTSSYGRMEFDFFVSQDIVTLPRTMAFYGAPERGSQRGDGTDRLSLYFENSLSIVWQRTKIDLKDYKNIVLVHAGSDEAETQNANDIWSSCSGVGPVGDETGELVVRARDGSLHSVWGIATFSEDDLESTWIHELAHTLGITDLYIYGEDGYSESSGVGYWSLMDAGNMLDPPADIDGWNKYILGWIEPVTISLPKGEQIIYTLDSTRNPKSLLINIDNNEYYFVHARRKSGTDRSLPSEGVVVFRINKMLERSYGGSELALIADANPDTPRECALFGGSFYGICETVDAPYNRGKSYAFQRGRLSVNILLEKYVFWDDKSRIAFKAESIGMDSYRIALGRTLAEIGVENAPPVTFQHAITTSTTAGPGGECVIATAAYGSRLAPEVSFLRSFRDELSRSFLGDNLIRAINRFYYSFSPTLARTIENSFILSSVFRVLLLPFIEAAHVTSVMFRSIDISQDLAVIICVIEGSALVGTVYLTPLLLVLRILNKTQMKNIRNPF